MEFHILYAIQSLHTPLLDRLMVFISTLGNKGMVWIVLGLGLLCFRKTRRMGSAVLLSLLFGALIGNLWLKPWIARPRPCWLDPAVALLIPVPGDYSFPSGHTLASFASAMAVWMNGRRWGFAVFAVAVLMGVSRLYLFVHFPSDVVAGAVLGCICGFAAAVICRRLFPVDG